MNHQWHYVGKLAIRPHRREHQRGPLRSRSEAAAMPDGLRRAPRACAQSTRIAQSELEKRDFALLKELVAQDVEEVELQCDLK